MTIRDNDDSGPDDGHVVDKKERNHLLTDKCLQENKESLFGHKMHVLKKRSLQTHLRG